MRPLVFQQIILLKPVHLLASTSTAFSATRTSAALATVRQECRYSVRVGSSDDHLVAIRTMLPSMMTAFQRFANASDGLKVHYSAIAYKPFLSLFNITGVVANGALPPAIGNSVAVLLIPFVDPDTVFAISRLCLRRRTGAPSNWRPGPRRSIQLQERLRDGRRRPKPLPIVPYDVPRVGRHDGRRRPSLGVPRGLRAHRGEQHARLVQRLRPDERAGMRTAPLCCERYERGEWRALGLEDLEGRRWVPWGGLGYRCDAHGDRGCGLPWLPDVWKDAKAEEQAVRERG